MPKNTIPAAPLGCKYQDNSLSFCYGILRSLIRSSIPGLIFVIWLSYLINFYWYPDENDMPFSYRIFMFVATLWGGCLGSYLVFKHISVREYYILDKDGFHFKRCNSFQEIPPDVEKNDDNCKDIPLWDIFRFRLQHDEFGSYIEAVTTDSPFRFCRSSKENWKQKWFVEAGNAVLSNLTGGYSGNNDNQEESSESPSEQEALYSCNLSTPFFCTFRDRYLSYMKFGYSLILVFAPLVAIIVGFGSYFNIFFYVPAVLKEIFSCLFTLAFFSGTFIILSSKDESAYLDENGFHYSETALNFKKYRYPYHVKGIYYSEEFFSLLGIRYLKTIKIDIPLSDILKFRLQNDETGVFVEIITRYQPIRIYHSCSFSKKGNKTQNWLVDAGNAILSNLKGVDCKNLEIQADACECTIARIYRNDHSNAVQTFELSDWNAKTESDRVEITRRGYISPSVSRSTLTAAILFVSAICTGAVAAYYRSLRLSDATYSDQFHIEMICSTATILLIVFCVLKIIKADYSEMISQRWIFTSKNAIRKRDLFGIVFSRRKFDLTSLSYMEIRKDYQRQLVLFDENDRIICQINDLNSNDVIWIANNIQQLL